MLQRPWENVEVSRRAICMLPLPMLVVTIHCQKTDEIILSTFCPIHLVCCLNFSSMVATNQRDVPLLCNCFDQKSFDQNFFLDGCCSTKELHDFACFPL